jgi:hypothetical protein
VIGIREVEYYMPFYELQVEIGQIVLYLGLRIHRVSLRVCKAFALVVVLNYRSLDLLY